MKTLNPLLARRADAIFRETLDETYCRTDRLFAGLMAIQWMASVALTLTLSPRTWNGSASSVHPHVWLSLIGGAVFMGPPMLLAFLAPGRAVTRHAIAVGQMLESALLIHLTGGRIETHFHIFGSLAFLAFYRDWRVLVTGSLIVAGDHIFRGHFWPQSVYGALFGAELRWLEHAGWVAFMDAFLIRAICQNLKEMRSMAARRAQLETHQEWVEAEVVRRSHELRESEQRFREMAEHIDEVFWVTSPDLSRIHFISPGYEKIWGRSRAELMEHPESWTEAIHPDDRERVWKAASAHAQIGTYSATYRIVRPDGSMRWVFDHGTAIRDAEGRVVRLAGSVVDVTTLKEAEERLVRSNSELERFAYVASHDLQEPLRSVGSFLQLLREKYRGRLDRDADEYIEFAVNGARRMKELIGALLEYGRLDYQARPIEKVDLNIVFDIALENLQASILESGARITRDRLPELPADGAQIAQVFQNLIANAIKFRGDRPARIHVGVESAGTERIFKVRDNGIGFDGQYADHVFQIFKRLNGQKYPGSGIGLSICKKIVERHNGRIWAESATGQGATFYFSLPSAQASRLPAVPPGPPPSRRVLVVDDDPMSRKLIRKALESLGVAVDEATTGPEGIDMARRLHPGAVLLDVNLPGLDGNRVRKVLREDPATRDLRVIMITSDADLLDSEFAVTADWMSKPLSPTELRGRVEALVGAEA